MDEQDEDERKMIMKMLGAKEMKHLHEQEEQDKKKGPKGKKPQKKKGIDKYIEEKEEGDENIINTDKVLFLKKKKDKDGKEGSPD